MKVGNNLEHVFDFKISKVNRIIASTHWQDAFYNNLKLEGPMKKSHAT